MFKKIHRVSSWLFKPTMKSKTHFSSYFRIKYLKTSTDFKISIVVPKKIIKKRVARNTLKRKILHYIKQSIVTDKNFYCVFWMSKDISTIEKKIWQNDIDQIIHKLGIKK
jgi:ribonuclease P protein component